MEMYFVDSNLFYYTTALQFREERARLLPYEGRVERRQRRKGGRKRRDLERQMNERGRHTEKGRALGKGEEGRKEERRVGGRIIAMRAHSVLGTVLIAPWINSTNPQSNPARTVCYYLHCTDDNTLVGTVSRHPILLPPFHFLQIMCHYLQQYY